MSDTISLTVTGLKMTLVTCGECGALVAPDDEHYCERF